MFRILFLSTALLAVPLAAGARDPTPEMRARIEAALRGHDGFCIRLLNVRRRS